MGHRFTIVTSRYSYLTGTKKSDLTREDGIDVRYAWVIGDWHRSYLYRTFAFLSFMVSAVIEGLRVEVFDAVIGTSPPIFQALSAWPVAVIKDRPLIFKVRCHSTQF